jgi:hypothetical protein
MAAFETAYFEAMAIFGLTGNALESGQPQGFLGLHRKSSIDGKD